ncbi:hypothetical protein [Polaromonas jejuensis]|uniref:Uncharacterized protein n=1 Tax=Polaromonas jejuensis TaxID=457502 RepID=A0ABW0Q784_9BURK|nr:hypothetical protein [Polaromonas jejuensis]
MKIFPRKNLEIINPKEGGLLIQHNASVFYCFHRSIGLPDFNKVFLWPSRVFDLTESQFVEDGLLEFCCQRRRLYPRQLCIGLSCMVTTRLSIVEISSGPGGLVAQLLTYL